MILMLQIFDVTANENALCKCNELEESFSHWFCGALLLVPQWQYMYINSFMFYIYK